MSSVAEQSPPRPVPHNDFDPKALAALLVPFANFGNARKKHWEGEPDWAFVEALRVGPQEQAPIGGDADIDIHCEVLMGSEIIDDAMALFTVDHVCVKTPGALRMEGPDPRDRLAA